MRPAGIARLIVAATLAAGALAGCSGSPDNPRIVDHSRLATDLATRLSRSGTLTYTATYTLPASATVTIVQAQQPLRVAFIYPGGRLVITPTLSMDCRRPGSPSPSPAPTRSGSPDGAGMCCLLTAPPSPSTDEVTAMLRQAGFHGLVAPGAVAGMLSAAALDNNAVIDQRDTTIAGENATCVHVTGTENADASAFTVCITAGGVLGSFQGTVDGTAVNLTLDQYDDRVAPDAFVVPDGATLEDSRPK